MAFKKKFDGRTDKTIQLGGGANPTRIEGYFLGSKDTQSDYGPGKLHIFQTEEGTIGVWGKTRLNNLLTSDLVGQMVQVNFTGMIEPVKKGRRPSYGYEVLHDADNTTDVSGIDLNAASAEESDDSEETSEEEAYATISDEIAPSRPVAPRVAAKAPDSLLQAKAQALLSKSRQRV